MQYSQKAKNINLLFTERSFKIHIEQLQAWLIKKKLNMYVLTTHPWQQIIYEVWEMLISLAAGKYLKHFSIHHNNSDVAITNTDTLQYQLFLFNCCFVYFFHCFFD